DSHVHVAFGDYTPRQQAVGYLESYVHGGVTTAISASEVHVPGRPRDAEGVKALAVAARKCFDHYRPGGMTVHAGSIILEPGLTAMPDRDFERIIRESDIALQICTAGNLRTALLCASLAQRLEAFDRLIIGTDTPTGSGIMPLGMLYTIAHLSSLAGIAPEMAIAAATGSNARVYRLDCGALAAGKAADIVLIDAPEGGTQGDALSAIRNGD